MIHNIRKEKSGNSLQYYATQEKRIPYLRQSDCCLEDDHTIDYITALALATMRRLFVCATGGQGETM